MTRWEKNHNKMWGVLITQTPSKNVIFWWTFYIFCLQFICCTLRFTLMLYSCSTSTLGSKCHVSVYHLIKFLPPSLNKGAKVYLSSNPDEDKHKKLMGDAKAVLKKWLLGFLHLDLYDRVWWRWRQCEHRCLNCCRHWNVDFDYCVLRGKKKLPVFEEWQLVCGCCICVLDSLPQLPSGISM